MSATLAYVVSRFPLLTETFVVHEVQTLDALGWPVHMFAMRHQHQAVAHPGARHLEARVHFPAPRSTFAASIGLLRHHPDHWARLVRMTVAEHACSPRFLAKTLLVLPIAIAWAERMRALRVRHIHAHFGSFPAYAALVAAELQGIGFSFTVHAHDLFADNVMLAEKVRRARFVITISDFNRNRLAALVGPADARRISVIHCGVDRELFPFTPGRSAGNQHTLLSVAALREYKGLHNLIEACRLLRRSTPEQGFECRIIGDGPQRTALERQIRASGLERCVRLLGARDQRAVRELLRASDTFVLPSVVARNGYMDGIPVALMEAMASGVPVIASSLSGIPELVRDGDTGLLTPPGCAGAIHDAVLRCWADPAQSAERAARARALIEREYDLHRNTRQLAQLFGAAVSGPPSCGRGGR